MDNIKLEAGISPKELAKQIRQAADVLNNLVEEASKAGLAVDITINSAYKYGPLVRIGKITQNL